VTDLTATIPASQTAIPASQTTIPAYDSSGLRWVVTHDGCPAGIVTEQAADFGTWGEVSAAHAWLTKLGAVNVRVIDMSA